MSQPTQPLLDIKNLSVHYRGVGRRPFKAVDDVSVQVNPGETVGLVGESGSGKTTVGNAALGLAPIAAGQIIFDGQDITHASHKQRRAVSADLQVVFQDPYSSLNPSRTVFQTLVEPLLVHRKLTRKESADQVAAMLEKVGLAKSAGARYPHHFSGGQRQRIAIARALMLSPKLVICDEAVSALDLSVQAQVLNLLLSLQKDLGVSYLFISHDLSVVNHMCERLVVLYRGRVMETGATSGVRERPAHPYTQTLLSASPIPNPGAQRRQRELIALAARPARPEAATDACPFANRCPLTIDVCETTVPPLTKSSAGTLAACHRKDEAAVAFTAAAEHLEDAER
jgi:oligopeptide/dipeptide ABC transporter ATP-binding protein